MKCEMNIGFDHVFSIPQQVLDFDGFFTFFYKGIGDFCYVSAKFLHSSAHSSSPHVHPPDENTTCTPALTHRRGRASREAGM